MKSRHLLLLSTLFTPALQAEVQHIDTYGFIVSNQVLVRTEPEQSWRALVEDVGKWWPADHSWWGKAENFSIEARAGGCFCEINGDSQAQHMQISFVEPAKLLRMTGGLGPLQGMGLYGALDWQFEAVEGGTRITLSYKVHGYAPNGFKDLAPIVDQVQGLQLGGLGKHLGMLGPAGTN
ncbi:SRPBCC family protein [Bowmanella dokdonensis]|uniref:SRPBCC domain-containing protein n=1 Tax=Bowmanella dokdonensis TaxID=751969 RepID=A0A939DM49_9ALTE|nr:SRPBCC domain-containing protein [Bowmanella dokdonensis]MBN7825125.1 SRPBCC domain-containing protein [Bowmanella dokdonensis]